MAAGFGGTTGVAVSGAGAESTNIILTRANALAKNSHLHSAGGVSFEATMTGVIDAKVIAASVAVGAGGTTGVGASIGIAVARNFIGWEPNASTTFTYTSTERPATLTSGNRVKIASGPRTGDVYEYSGATLTGAAFDYADYDDMSEATVVSGGIVAGTRVKRTSDGKVFRYAPAYDYVSTATLTDGLAVGKRVLHDGRVYTYAGAPLTGTVDLATQIYPSGDWTLVTPPSDLSAEDYTDTAKWASVPDGVELETLDYSDTSIWKHVGVDRKAALVEAKVENTSVQAPGALQLTATSTQTIDAIVVAGSVAIGGGGTTGVAASGAGAYAENRVATEVRAAIDGTGTTEISVGSITGTATDATKIKAIVGAASIAGSVGGSVGVSISIGLSIAINQVSNNVEAYLKDADVTTTTGGVSLSAITAAAPLFSSSAVTAAQLDDVAESDDTVGRLGRRRRHPPVDRHDVRRELDRAGDDRHDLDRRALHDGGRHEVAQDR